eukprot:3794073-Pyramimonas_sp.AAC.1
MREYPETEAHWLRGLLPRRRNPVPDPPAWGDWGGSCWTTAGAGPKLLARELVAVDPEQCSMAFVGGSGISNDMHTNRVGWGLALQLRDGQQQQQLGQARTWRDDALEEQGGPPGVQHISAHEQRQGSRPSLWTGHIDGTDHIGVCDAIDGGQSVPAAEHAGPFWALALAKGPIEIVMDCQQV